MIPMAILNVWKYKIFIWTPVGTIQKRGRNLKEPYGSNVINWLFLNIIGQTRALWNALIKARPVVKVSERLDDQGTPSGHFEQSYDLLDRKIKILAKMVIFHIEKWPQGVPWDSQAESPIVLIPWPLNAPWWERFRELLFPQKCW